MKKSKILIAGVIAVAVCGMLTICGKEKEEIIEETKPTMYAVKKFLYGNDEDSEDGTAEEVTEEKAVELCQKAYDALSSAEDMAEIASTCDM